MFVAIAGGVGGAASAPPGRIIFSSPLPVYPLPDNFQSSQQFSIRLDGRGRRELNPAPDWTWSRDRSHLYFTRDTAAGSELWVERSDATGAHRLALLAGSGPATSLGWSPDYSKLDVVAGALWVVGADGSDPRSVFAPQDGASVSDVTWSPDGSRLIFVAGDLWMVGADGGDATRLFAANQADPVGYTVSPDGSRIIVDNGGAWLLSSGGGQLIELPADASGTIDWSPRGGSFAAENVSFAGCKGADYKCAEWYLLLFRGDGTLIRRLDEARSASWSPDGRRLAFEAETAVDPEDGTIDVVSADGSGRRAVSRKVSKDEGDCWRYPGWQGNMRVTFVSGGCDPDYLDYAYSTAVVEVPNGRIVSTLAGINRAASPKGRSFAYLEPVGNDVRLIEVGSGGKRLRLSPLHGTVDEFAWSPDGRFIAYVYGGDAGGQVYVVNSSGGRPRQVTHELSTSYESSISWSHDGRTLFYESSLDENNGDVLWTVDAAGGDAHRLTHDHTSDQSPAWSPDGRSVAYTAYHGDAAEIDVVNADGTGAHRLVGKAGEKDTQPAWSPDGKRLAFVQDKGNSLFLGVVNTDGTGVHILTHAGSPYGSPTWSPDGSEIVFSDGGTALVSVAPDGTNPHPLVKHECTSAVCTWFGDAAFSPDGSLIAVDCSYCDPDTQSGIWVLRADGTGLSRVAAIVGVHPTWSPDGTAIAFSGPCDPPSAQNTNPPYQLCIVGVDGSNLHAVTTWPDGARAPNWSRR
jgi:Tol biopolymer transport system component